MKLVDIEKIINNVKAAGSLYCKTAKCKKECERCNHKHIMLTIVEIIKGGVQK